MSWLSSIYLKCHSIFKICSLKLLSISFILLAEGLIGLLERRRGQDGAYIGCMKSGEVITEEYALYHILVQPDRDCLSCWYMILYIFEYVVVHFIGQLEF